MKRSGRIVVANGIQFEGIHGSDTKESIDVLIATGNIRNFDATGRLFVGRPRRRDDRLGGENCLHEQARVPWAIFRNSRPA